MPVIIENKYEVTGILGEGSFGKIFKGININSKEEVAIKIEKEEDSILLKNEARIYRDLMDKTGIPKIRSFGMEGGVRYMVMDLLGKSLEDVREDYKNKKLPVRMVLDIGIQITKLLKIIHESGFIHRDIKPENFLYSKNTSKNILYAVDFGLACRYLDDKSNHIEMKTGKNIVGTSRYVSINIHEGRSASRRDDLESLAYMLVYLLEGELPWQGIHEDNMEDKNNKIIELKKTSLCCNDMNYMVGEIIIYIQYCRKLKYSETPDYNYLIILLQNLSKHVETKTR